MVHDASKPDSSWHAAILMAAKEMLKFGYQLGQGLGTIGRGFLTLIELSDNEGRFSLGSKHTHEELL